MPTSARDDVGIVPYKAYFEHIPSIRGWEGNSLPAILLF